MSYTDTLVSILIIDWRTVGATHDLRLTTLNGSEKFFFLSVSLSVSLKSIEDFFNTEVKKNSQDLYKSTSIPSHAKCFQS